MLRDKLIAGRRRGDDVAGSTASVTKIAHVLPSRDDGMTIR